MKVKPIQEIYRSHYHSKEIHLFQFWNQTLQRSLKQNFYYTIKKIYGPFTYLDLTRKNVSWESVREAKKMEATSFVLRQEDTTIYSILIGNVISSTVINPMKMKLIFY